MVPMEGERTSTKSSFTKQMNTYTLFLANQLISEAWTYQLLNLRSLAMILFCFYFIHEYVVIDRIKPWPWCPVSALNETFRRPLNLISIWWHRFVASCGISLAYTVYRSRPFRWFNHDDEYRETERNLLCTHILSRRRSLRTGCDDDDWCHQERAGHWQQLQCDKIWRKKNRIGFLVNGLQLNCDCCRW